MCSLCSSGSREEPGDGARRYHVLVVDDEPAIRRSLRRYLERRGCRVEEAEDGRRARAWLEDGTFDLVVSDLDMGPEDGVALWEWIAAQRPELRSRVLIFSARTPPATLQAHGVAYLPKPSSLAEVWAALRALAASGAG